MGGVVGISVMAEDGWGWEGGGGKRGVGGGGGSEDVRKEREGEMEVLERLWKRTKKIMEGNRHDSICFVASGCKKTTEEENEIIPRQPQRAKARTEEE